ncbi:MAG: winged helix-turn-helix domain-containing protein [Anaerolineales bacterium]
MEKSTNTERDRVLLEEIERDPDTTQATLAGKLGVAVGTVNWHVKRLIAKGYVKVKRAERRKLRYIITPEGIALRARLTVAYVENSMHLYRQSRLRAIEALKSARKRGFDSILIEGDGDIADVVRLTCIEQGFEVVSDGREGSIGVLEIRGQKIRLREEEAG